MHRTIDFWRFSAVSLIFILKCFEKRKNRNLLLRRRLVFNCQLFLAETTHSWKSLAASGGGRWDFRFCGFGQCLVRFWCLAQFAAFHQCSLWFSVLSTMMAVFRNFFVRCVVRFFWFCGFAKEIIPRSRAKTGVIPRSDQRTIYIAFYRLF